MTKSLCKTLWLNVCKMTKTYIIFVRKLSGEVTAYFSPQEIFFPSLSKAIICRLDVCFLVDNPFFKLKVTARTV